MRDITFTRSDNQLIFEIIIGHYNTSWMVGFIYAIINGTEQRRLWMQIEIVLQLELPLIILDDFNCILNELDKQEGKSF